jgi:predicted DCC family thiol-disulfide oxidoreductase YuxK
MADQLATEVNMAEDSITMLYDGDCPICRHEACRLSERGSRIELQNIAAADFDAAKYGLSKDQVMRVLHVVLPDGRVLKRMDAVRKVYDVAGLGRLARWTCLPVVRQITDLMYALFARFRARLGRLLPNPPDPSPKGEGEQGFATKRFIAGAPPSL